VFYANASASGSSKSQMLPSLLPLPASFFKVFPLPAFFFKVLPLPQKFNRFHRFRFHIPGLVVQLACFQKDLHSITNLLFRD